jgi:hypothetical protein
LVSYLTFFTLTLNLSEILFVRIFYAWLTGEINEKVISLLGGLSIFTQKWLSLNSQSMVCPIIQVEFRTRALYKFRILLFLLESDKLMVMNKVCKLIWGHVLSYRIKELLFQLHSMSRVKPNNFLCNFGVVVTAVARKKKRLIYFSHLQWESGFLGEKSYEIHFYERTLDFATCSLVAQE